MTAPIELRQCLCPRARWSTRQRPRNSVVRPAHHGSGRQNQIAATYNFERTNRMRTLILIFLILGCIACTPAYTPLSYSTAAVEPSVDCAKYVLPGDVELLRKAGAWQIGRVETARVTATAARIVAQHGGTHFYRDDRTLMAVHVPEEKMSRLPEPLRPSDERYPHGCTEESFR
jgi:hypothetical protein